MVTSEVPRTQPELQPKSKEEQIAEIMGRLAMAATKYNDLNSVGLEQLYPGTLTTESAARAHEMDMLSQEMKRLREMKASLEESPIDD